MDLKSKWFQLDAFISPAIVISALGTYNGVIFATSKMTVSIPAEPHSGSFFRVGLPENPEQCKMLSAEVDRPF